VLIKDIVDSSGGLKMVTAKMCIAAMSGIIAAYYRFHHALFISYQ
jgi:hypothetical protein